MPQISCILLAGALIAGHPLFLSSLAAEEAPAPFELETLTGESPSYHAPIPPLQPMPTVDTEALYQAVLACYPAPSQFDLSVKLRAGADLRSATPLEFSDRTLAGGSSYYVGIVAELPLWDNSEATDRQRTREYQRRLQLGQQVAAFVAALTERNAAARKLGLYLALEQRSQQRVQRGLAPVAEQVGYLEKVIDAKQQLTNAQATVTQTQLALVGQCHVQSAPSVRRYLAAITSQTALP